MSTPRSQALHPLSFEFAARVADGSARERQLAQWRRIHGVDVAAPAARLLAEHPLVASARLQQEIDRHVAELGAFLGSRLAAGDALPAWQGLGAPDVVSADLAVIADPAAPDGWALRWVEFQAFTSIISSVHTLHQGAPEIWPETRDLQAWRLQEGETDWLRAARNWAAPAGSILLERAPTEQGSRFDLEAAARLFGLTFVEPHQLVRTGATLAFRGGDGRLRPVSHVFNRLVMHELADRPSFERTVNGADVTWHSHPAWYYGISKAWLPYLPQDSSERCAPATDWRSLGLPAAALVAKNANSHGGAAVHLHVDERMLDSLADPEHWVVQPRYQPQPLFAARDGHPLFGEIRCVIAMPRGQKPWVATQLMRVSRGTKASAAALTELPGSGLSVLYRPPEG